MSETITCPSGLTGRIRAMLVREERILGDRKLAKAGGQVDELLAACWEETLEAGPYDFGDKAIDWGKVLQGDRFFALLKTRALTYGAKYAFSVPCQNDACRARIEWELDLNELPCRSLSDESRAAFNAGTASRPYCPTRASGSGSSCSAAPTSASSRSSGAGPATGCSRPCSPSACSRSRAWRRATGARSSRS